MRRAGCRDARPHRLHRRRGAGLPRRRVRLPHRRLRRRRPARDGQGQLRGRRPVPDPGGADHAARGHHQHDPEHRVPRLRLPQVAWATESQLDAGAGGSASTGWSPPAEPGRPRARRSSAAIEAAADGEWRESLDKAAELIGWDDAARAGPGPRHRGRHQAGGDLGAVAEPGAASWPTAARSSTPAPRTWARAPARCGSRSSPTSWAHRWSRSASSAGTPASCPSTCRPRPAARRSSWATAVLEACKDMRQRVLALYAEATGVPAEELASGPGCWSPPTGAAPARGLTGGARVAAAASSSARAPRGCAAREAPAGRGRGLLRVQLHRDRGRGRPGDRGAAADQARAVSDVGTELNPLQVVSQDEGAAIMGLGHSQMEQLLLDEHGVIRNLGALDYRIPTFKDVPLELVTRGRREPRRPRPLRLQGDQRGRAAVHGRGAGRRGRRGRRRRDPRPAADPGTGVGGDPGGGADRPE